MDLELIILLMVIVTNIVMYIIWLKFNKLEQKIEHITVWAEELEEWFEESNEHGWIPLDEIKINIKGDK